MENITVILGFSFGNRGTEPGLSNEHLASTIRFGELAKPHTTPIVIVQQEISTALQELGITPSCEITTHAKPRKYLDTKEVARQMTKLLKELPLENVTIKVIAHPDHLPRCVTTLKRMGLTTIESIYCAAPFDPLSCQWWTRSRFLFQIHELFLAPLLFWQNLKRP